MSTKELRKGIISPALRAAIAVSVQEILSDPDFGLELRPEIKKRLRASLKDKKPGLSLAQVRAKYC